jgi:hypothetical protein
VVVRIKTGLAKEPPIIFNHIREVLKGLIVIGTRDRNLLKPWRETIAGRCYAMREHFGTVAGARDRFPETAHATPPKKAKKLTAQHSAPIK